MVKADDEIKEYTSVEYRVNSIEQLVKAFSMLQEQLGDQYIVEVPHSYDKCIVIRRGNAL